MIALEPVDAATVTVLVDNLTDAFMPDEGPARRSSFTAEPRARARTLEGGEVVEQLRVEHGLQRSSPWNKEGRQHRVLFYVGVSPDGLAHNMRFLEIDPETVQTVVLSHGHFDHTTGLDGFVRAAGHANILVVIHPEFWNRRRLVLPGREP